MHMTCRPPGGCGHEFCWICMKDWKNHQNCNQYKEEEKSEVKKARTEIQKYAFYWERYAAHDRAQRVTNTKHMDKVACLEQCFDAEKDLTLKDVEFLREGTIQIARCRCFLKWTYALGYFMKCRQDLKKLFEFHQAQLEGTLERLSDIMENTPWEEFLDDV